MPENQDLYQRVLHSKDLMQKYLHLQAEYLRLEVAQRSATLVSALAESLLWSLLAITLVFGLSFAMGWWLSYLLDSVAQAIMIVIGFYFLIILFLIIFRKNLIVKPLKYIVYSAMLDEED